MQKFFGSISSFTSFGGEVEQFQLLHGDRNLSSCVKAQNSPDDVAGADGPLLNRIQQQ